MSLRHFTLTLLFGIATTIAATAMPADPKPKQFRQPDGTVVTVLLRGDEHAHVMLTDDGYPMVYNPAKQQMELARLSGGKLVASGVAATNSSSRPAETERYAKAMDKDAMIKAALSGRQANGIATPSLTRRTYTEPDGYKHAKINDFPTLGHMKTLCLLVEFNDVKFTSVDDPKTFYTNMLNEHGFTYSNGANGSARDFYNDASTNQFDPEWEVVGPITLPKVATYYGKDDPSQDANMGELVKYACEQADSMGVDFSQYDYDGDGIVDNICVIYAGYGQADSPYSDVIWPHAAVMQDDWGIDISFDGKKIGHYFCSNELRYNADATVKIPTGIGTVVHEFGHILGLPDLYDVSYNMLSSLMGYGLYYWETMAAGSYNNNSNTPPTFSSYERLVLGWMTPKDITADIDSIIALPNLATSNTAYRVKVEGKPGEYFMLENRQKTGWDEYVYDHGMLIWHIDEIDSLWANNHINNITDHQHVDLVEVTGSQDNNPNHDAMPGQANVSSYRLNNWDGGHVITLDDVSEDDSIVRVLVSPSAYVMAAPEKITFGEVRDSSLTFEWSPVADAKYYIVSVYRTSEGNTKEYVDTLNNARFANAESVSLSNLTPDTEYTVEVKAVRGSYESALTAGTTRTEKLDFVERKSLSTTITDATPNGFTAHWSAIDDATDYELTVYRHDYGTATDTKGYDFSGRSAGMPELWSSSSTTFYSVSGYYGASSPSLRLGRDSDYIEIVFPESRIQKLQFWCRSSREGNYLTIEKFEDGAWTTVDTHAVAVDAETVETEIGNADRVRIRLNRTSGFVAIDDIVATCLSIARIPVVGYDALNVGNVLEHTVTGLTPGQYSFRVRGVLNGERSLMSDEVQVTLDSSTGISKVNTASSPAEYFDLSGRKVPATIIVRGLYIIKENGKARKAIK